MSDLANYHNETVRALNADQHSDDFVEESGDEYDLATDLAVNLLQAAGLEYHDTDKLENPVSDDVQTLLTLAIFRSPEVREYIAGVLP